jgi:hypothetical protein
MIGNIWITAFAIKAIMGLGLAPQKGMVQGRVTDAKGNPIAGVRVVVENTVFHASYTYGITNADGYYKATVPHGSWHVTAQLQREFLGKTYRFELHPDTDDDFAGTKGAIRNFTWKLSGAKPRNAGYYGSSIAVYSQPGSAFAMDEIELTLTPDGPLADGSKGNVITSKLADIGGGEDGIRDIPIGKYIITAINVATGKRLQVRQRNKGDYDNSFSAVFESGFTGACHYQVVVEIK